MRVKERRDYWLELIEKQAASGTNGAAFCKNQHINPQRFYSWRRRLRHSSTAAFIRLVPDSDSPSSGIRIRLDHRISLEVERGFDVLTLREIINALCPKG